MLRVQCEAEDEEVLHGGEQLNEHRNNLAGCQQMFWYAHSEVRDSRTHSHLQVQMSLKEEVYT